MRHFLWGATGPMKDVWNRLFQRNIGRDEEQRAQDNQTMVCLFARFIFFFFQFAMRLASNASVYVHN